MKTFVINQIVETIVISDSINVLDFKYGIWAIPNRDNGFELLKLTQSTYNNNDYYAFYKMCGRHGGFSNYTRLSDCLNKMHDNFKIVAPETKEELIQIFRVHV